MLIEQIYIAQLPYNEIYRRLGYTQDTKLPEATRQKIEITIQISAGLCSAQAVSKIINPNELAELTAQSKDLAKFISKYQEIVLFGVTVGSAIIEARDKIMSADPATGIIYDAVGSEIVEKALNIYQNKLKIELRRAGKNLATPRYSPGYGDCAIQAQDIFFKNLPMDRLGVKLTTSYIMQPEKTITAFAGINY